MPQYCVKPAVPSHTVGKWLNHNKVDDNDDNIYINIDSIREIALDGFLSKDYARLNSLMDLMMDKRSI